MESSSIIRYDDFVRICNVDDPRDFAGFQVNPQGLYVNLPPDDSMLLPMERAALSWHPTGRHDEPALPFPCTFSELQTFISEAGLLGAIDEFELDAQPVKETSAPVEEASDDPAPLTTSEIAGCLAGFHGWDAAKWKTNLQSPAPWLLACRHQPGKQGRPYTESTWWPVKIAVELDKKHGDIRRKLHARFKNQEPLKPWLESIENSLSVDC